MKESQTKQEKEYIIEIALKKEKENSFGLKKLIKTFGI